MKNQSFLFRLVVLVAAMMCALGASAAEAYACYTPENTTLTFYYDNQRSSRSGTTYDLNTGSNDTGWDTDGTKSNVTKVVFDPSFANARPTTTYDWFYNMKNLESITGMSYLNTSQVTNMALMFARCYKLTSLDLSHFNTSNVTNMADMFDRSTGLTSLDLSGFNTSRVTSMGHMFDICTNLKTIYVGEGWSTAAVTSSSMMFYNCTSLVGGQGTVYDASHVDKDYAHIDGGASNPGYFTAAGIKAYACYTSSNTTLTFYYDTQRSSRPGTTYSLNTGENDPGWKTDGTNANVTKVVFDPSFALARPSTTYTWFFNMQNLQTIEGMEYLNTSEVTNMAYMFGLCTSLTSLGLSSFNTSKVTNMKGMFDGCGGLKSLNLSSFNTSKVNEMSNMFYECFNLLSIFVGNAWTTSTVDSSGRMFYSCNSLVGGQGTTYSSSNPQDKTYAHIDGGASNPGYFTATGTQAYACYTSSNTTLTFYYDTQRSSRTGTTYSLNTGENDPGWKTDGTNANVTKVVFDPSFAGAHPTTTCLWFYLMRNLQTIEGIEYLNTSEVTNMAHMFNSCSRLTSLDLSSFNTSKVTDMRIMFYNCSGLTSLDLGGFYTANVTNMFNMFGNCSSLRTVYVDGGLWWTGAVTNSSLMFSGCTSLVGGEGTTYDANHIDKAYAHIDGGPSNPGYFTDAGTEAYACYRPESRTLTFYYDAYRINRPGTTYDLNTDSDNPGWITDGTNANVTRVEFDSWFAGAHPTTTYMWFYLMRNLQTITGIEYLNTSEVTNMAHMFNTCSSLTSIDISGFNTSKVTDMRVMFCNCTGLTSLDLSSFNTSNVTNMFNIFGGCSSLTNLDLSSFNTSNVTDMGRMFYGCSRLTTVYVGEDWSTEAVTSSSYMFHNNNNLVGGQGTVYNGSNPKDKTYAHIDGGASDPGYFTAAGIEAYAVYTPENTTLTFYYDTERDSRPGTTYDLNTGARDPGWYTDSTYANVTKVVFDPSFAGARPTTTYEWFYVMKKLQSITGMDYLNTSEVTDMRYMFCGCNKLTSIDLSYFNTSKVTHMYSMFYGCSALTSLDLSGFNTSNVVGMTNMFRNCGSLRTITVGEGWSTDAVTYSDNMFGDDISLVGGQGTTWNESNPKDKTYAHIDGGASDPGYFTAAGTQAYAVYTPENTTLTFYHDTERGSRPGTTYDLNIGQNDPGWKTDGSNANVTKVVFDPSFAGARPTTTYEWFFVMQNLQTIESMEYLNTSEVTNMWRMFAWCSELTSLDLSHFNTSKVVSMAYMFYRCTGLTSLDLSSFNTSNVTDMSAMFYNCPNLTTIYAGEGWSTEAVTNSTQMFNYATSLVGGQGTTYDASHIDAAYAHIDGGASNPGYFTDKNASMRGDVDSDGHVDINDVTKLIGVVLGTTTTGYNAAAADCDVAGGSGNIDINDVTALLNFVLNGHW